MISYLYWFVLIALLFVILFGLGARLNRWKPAIIVSAIVLASGTLLYYFYLEQMFVKRWGGSMSISVPAGQVHMGATWKDDNLWIQNYDPDTNTCIFSEYARGNLLEGRVVIRNCNPLLPARQPDTSTREN
ncbi:MAG: phage holin family protein [Alcanivorax sp.]|nr:phage holin family protein [Alcanivorax sp.]